MPLFALYAVWFKNARMRFAKRTLAATTVAPETNYAVGALRGGILRIAPLATTYQMRPPCAYADAADEGVCTVRREFDPIGTLVRATCERTRGARARRENEA